MSIQDRACTACRQAKKHDEFRFERGRNTLRSICKECERARDRARKAPVLELQRGYREWIHGSVLNEQEGLCFSCGNLINGFQAREVWSERCGKRINSVGIRTVRREYAQAVKDRLVWKKTREGLAPPTKRYVSTDGRDNATELGRWCVSTHEKPGIERDEEMLQRVASLACLCGQCWQRWVKPGASK